MRPLKATLFGESPGLGLPSHCIVKVLGELAPLVGLELEISNMRKLRGMEANGLLT